MFGTARHTSLELPLEYLKDLPSFNQLTCNRRFEAVSHLKRLVVNLNRFHFLPRWQV